MASPTNASVSELFEGALDALKLGLERPNIYGYTPYHEQELFHRCDKVGRYLAGGNRGGKTDSMVAEMVYWGTNTHPYLKRPAEWGTGALQMRCFVVDVEKGVSQILLPKLKRYVPTNHLIDGNWEKSWNSKSLIFTFANGTTIDFLTYGMGLEKMGGVPRHLIFFDEEPPKSIFTESLMRLLDYRGHWVIAATPVEGIGWTYDLLWERGIAHPEDPRSPGCFTLSASKNPYLKTTDEDFDHYGIAMDDAEKKMRFDGEFVARSGLIFPEFTESLNVVTFTDYFPSGRLPADWRVYSSVDHGLHNPTAWLWHAVSPEGDIISFEEHYRSEMLIEEHAAVVKEKERAWGRTPEVRTGDPAMSQRTAITGTNILQEYAKHGLPIGVEGVPRDVEIGLNIMRSAFKPRDNSFWGPGRPRWVISRNCPNLIRELKKLRYASYESQKQAYGKNKQEIVHKKDDHAFDSARYFATLTPNLAPDTRERQQDYLTGPRSYAELVADRVEQEQTDWSVSEIDDWEY